MNATNKLLDKWIAWCSAKQGAAPSVAAIAAALDVKPTAIANYRSNFSQAAPHVIAKMARDLGENEAAWLALVESERARNATDRKAWARVARSLFGAAALDHVLYVLKRSPRGGVSRPPP
jgi:2-hydroxychromene-2-carboxylate isomerase